MRDILVTVFILTAALTLCSCGQASLKGLTESDSSEFTADNLVGSVWLLNPGDTLLSFHWDGRYRMDPGGALGYSPDYSGSYEIADHELHLEQEQESSDGCPAGTTASARIEEVNGTLALRWLHSSCYREAAGTTWSFVRISPNSHLSPELPAVHPSTTFPPREGNIRGVWQVVGTSILISFDGKGAYSWDDQGLLAWEPVERGTYSLPGSPGRLLLTVATSTRCELGERLILSEAFMYSTPGLIRVLMADATDACGRVGGPVSLVLVSS